MSRELTSADYHTGTKVLVEAINACAKELRKMNERLDVINNEYKELLKAEGTDD